MGHSYVGHSYTGELITGTDDKVHDNHPQANTTSEKMQCITPTFKKKGLYVVEFSLNGPDFSVTVPKRVYAYYLNPKVRSVSPQLGPAEGNTRVTLESDPERARFFPCALWSHPSANGEMPEGLWREDRIGRHISP